MIGKKWTMGLFLFALILGFSQFYTTNASAQSTYFTSRGCVNCHSAPVVATCNGCHHHGDSSLAAVTNKTSYAPGETVTATLSGGSKSGWIRAVLYDQNSVQIAISNGNASGMGSSTTFPAALTAPAPATPGSYVWKMAFFGNQDGTGAGDVHSEKTVTLKAFTVVAAADSTPPVVNTFTLPATATSLTIPVSALIATDNVAVTGYLITTSASAPAAAAAGWSATAPASVTAAAAGTVTFYAWAKDAAGNVSLAQSDSVVITLPVSDTTKPVVGTFTLPATSTSLTIPVSALAATDNVAVTGYLVTTSATAPTAAAAGWSATAPTSVTAPAAGSITFYAWAKDAAGNVSLSKSAGVTITSGVDTTKPALTISALANGSYTNKPTLNISGSATDAGGLQSVTVNGQAIVVNANGSFSYALSLVSGPNIVTVIAIDNAGNQQTDSRTINYDPTAPVLTVLSPADNSSSAQSFITLTGTINETSAVTITDNSGSQQSASITGNNFTANVNLMPGVNTITIAATDLAGNTTSAKRTVTYASGTLTMAITNPVQDITTNKMALVLQGKIVGSVGKVTVNIAMDGKTYSQIAHNGIFRRRLVFKTAKTYTIVVTATDNAGNSSSITRNVIYQPNGHINDEHDD